LITIAAATVPAICHVIVKDRFDKLPPMSDEETAMRPGLTPWLSSKFFMHRRSNTSGAAKAKRSSINDLTWKDTEDIAIELVESFQI
jgi:hypothetical protein